MAAPRGMSERTKAEIVAAARRLFAEKGFTAVSIRDIAKAAGVTHGLVHYYFNTRERLMEEVVRAEVTSGVEMLLANPADDPADARDVMRRVLRHFMTEKRTSLTLIARAELIGLEPEKWRAPDSGGPLAMMAQRLAGMQDQAAPDGHRLDPALVGAYIGAAMFALSFMSPWLFSAVGLAADAYETRVDELVEVSMTLLGAATGLGAG